MSRIPPLRRPEPSEGDIRVGVPVSARTWTGLGQLANWILGKGAVLVPACTPMVKLTASDGMTPFFFFTRTRRSAIQHVWTIQASTTSSRSVKFTVRTVGGAAKVFALSGRGRRTFTYVQNVVAQGAAEQPIALYIEVTTSPGSIVIEAIKCHDQDRAVLQASPEDHGVDTFTLSPNQPMADFGYESIGGVVDGLANADARRVGLFHWTHVVYVEEPAGPTRLLTLDAPLLAQKAYRGETRVPVAWSVDALGTKGEVALVTGSGVRDAIRGGSGEWSIPRIIEVDCEDLDQPDGRPSGAWGESVNVEITGGGVGNETYLKGVSVWTPDRSLLLDLTRGTFARASVATYQTDADSVAHAASGELRIEDRGDGPRVLLEPKGNTNHVPWSNAIDNWRAGNGAVVYPDVVAPDGSETACGVIFPTGGSGPSSWAQVRTTVPTMPDASLDCTISFWAKRLSGDGKIQARLIRRDGTTYTGTAPWEFTATDQWQRFSTSQWAGNPAANKLPAPGSVSWSGAGGTPTITTGQADPVGGTNAVRILDDDPAAYESVACTTGAYPSDSPVRAELWLKKDVAAPNTVEIKLRSNLGDFSGSQGVMVHLGTGAIHPRSSDYHDLSCVEAVTGWWRVRFRHPGAPGSTISYRFYPAAGLASSFPAATSAATGSATVYAPAVYNDLQVAILNPGSAAREFAIWGVQVEDGIGSTPIFNPSSLIVTNGASATRAGESLTFAPGTYPDTFRTNGFSFTFLPQESSADMLERLEGDGWSGVLVGFGGENDFLRLHNRSGALYLDVRSTSGETPLLPAPGSIIWTASGTVNTTGQADPFGGTAAVRLYDDSNTTSESAFTNPIDPQDETAVRVRLWLKKNASATWGTDVMLRRTQGGVATNMHDVRVRIDTGEFVVPNATQISNVSCVEAVPGWWLLEYTHSHADIASADSLQVRVYPSNIDLAVWPSIAGGGPVMGDVTVYAPQILFPWAQAVESGPLMFDANQPLTIEVAPTLGRLRLNGFNDGNGTYSGTPWSFIAGTLKLGDRPAGSSVPLNGSWSRYLRGL